MFSVNYLLELFLKYKYRLSVFMFFIITLLSLSLSLIVSPPEPEEERGRAAGQTVSGQRRIQDGPQEPGDDLRRDPRATAKLRHGPPGPRRGRRGRQRLRGRHLQL